MMGYIVRGLDPAPFRPLYGMNDTALAERLAERVVADADVGYPDRIALVDAPIGQALLLVHFVHQPAATPYRASHAVFIAEGAQTAATFADEVPPILARRMLSLRAFDRGGRMIAAELTPGVATEPVVQTMLADRGVAYLHAHFAVRGCYAARIERS